MPSRSGPRANAGWSCAAIAWASSRYTFISAEPDIYFGSELKTLFVHDEIERRIDLDGLNLYLSLNYIPGPWTMIEGIRKLPRVTGSNGRMDAIETGAWWTLKFSPQAISLDDAKRELDSLLQAPSKST